MIQTARGVIATPLELKPFEIALTGEVGAPLKEHVTDVCSTRYPEGEGLTNPIVGMCTSGILSC